MISCFLSYSEAYVDVMSTVRKLLDVLEFEVSIFDTPNQQPPMDVVRAEIKKADCVVVILGPDFRLSEPGMQAAAWPNEEAIFAASLEKPLALIMHPDTVPPKVLAGYQSPPSFDFLDPADYAKNVHNVVKHLLDLRRLVELPPGGNPYYFTQASFRCRIDGVAGRITNDVRHEAVARESLSVVHHASDTGLDLTSTARIELMNADSIAIVPTFGGSDHELSIEMLPANPHAQPYLVHIEPPLPAGARIGYRRRFELASFFPVTAEELEARSREPGFPRQFRHGDTQYYGQCFQIQSEMEQLGVTFSFSSNVRIRSCLAVALAGKGGMKNEQESSRINSPECLGLTLDEDTGETIVSLKVRRPLIGHDYLLLYEPGAARS